MFSKEKKLELIFRVISYSVSLIALLTLLVSGGISRLSAVFFLFLIGLAWKLEDSKWQISEKLGVAIIILLVPLFYLDYQFNLSGFSSRDAFTANNLSRLILALASIKLLQRKADRDWVFIYIISFFEILLAAGVGISPLFLFFLLLYLLSTFTAIIIFEIRKSSNSVLEKSEKQNVNLSNKVFEKSQLFKLPITGISILFGIFLIAVPLFFVFPRVGGAGFGSNIGGLSGFTGFSDSVRLGEIGKLQQNDEVVMRVRIKSESNHQLDYLRWRGVSLDNFEGQTWRKSKFQSSENLVKTESNYFILDKTNDISKLITQTVYLEPIDTPVLFALSRPVAIQGNFEFISKDSEGSISTLRRSSGRISYKVYSDNDLPDESLLLNDNQQYQDSFNRYLQLPKNLDERIPALAKKIVTETGAKSRFEQAKAIEQYLQNNYGYTLDLKAGGNDPLADFLFNVREGHCEYFASALAIMLRTQGIATRVVNGFQSGEYNETADVYVVRQKNAHSWVEVYFPKTRSWVPFDATPSAGQIVGEETTGISGKINKAMEALETFWIQYVVSYDNNEQRTLFMLVKTGLSDVQDNLSTWLNLLQERLIEWWHNVKGDNGAATSLLAIGTALAYLIGTILGVFILIRLWRRIRKIEIWKRISSILRRKKEKSIVEFYQRMQKVLAKRGLVRSASETPLEFAFALNMPQAVKITEKYNEVRFGEKKLSEEESVEIENWLQDLEKDK